MKLVYYMPSKAVRDELERHGFYPHVQAKPNKEDPKARDIELRLQHSKSAKGGRCVVKLIGCEGDLPDHAAIDNLWLAQLQSANRMLFGKKADGTSEEEDVDP